MVSACRFHQAFIDQWNHEVRNNREALLHASQGMSWARYWTDYMLEGEDAFLKKVAGRLKLTMGPNVRTLDAIYYKAGNEVLPEKKRPYPTRLEVYIEHEQGGDPEKEMYKLLVWPATLKVLIFYDWPCWEETTEHRRQWVANKLTQLFEMGRKIDSQRPGGSTAEYLLLIGKAKKREEPVTWRYLRAHDGNWPERPGRLREL